MEATTVILATHCYVQTMPYSFVTLVLLKLVLRGVVPITVRAQCWSLCTSMSEFIRATNTQSATLYCVARA